MKRLKTRLISFRVPEVAAVALERAGRAEGLSAAALLQARVIEANGHGEAVIRVRPVRQQDLVGHPELPGLGVEGT